MEMRLLIERTKCLIAAISYPKKSPEKPELKPNTHTYTFSTTPRSKG